MTTNQVLIGVGSILVLAFGSQILAGRLRVPALIVLLPVGFAAGVLIDDVDPEFLVRRDGRVDPVTGGSTPAPRPGDRPAGPGPTGFRESGAVGRHVSRPPEPRLSRRAVPGTVTHTARLTGVRARHSHGHCPIAAVSS
ncbi:hypothetical protein [Streptomyces sp. NPDC059916]|uniref:hypothetical protein n=1 Tax=Streptomyces sp. NPDC059916 TaxID=3347001 RepID=UPI00368119C7